MKVLLLAWGAVFGMTMAVSAGNAEAAAAFEKGAAAMKEHRYSRAADAFMEAKLQADSAKLKVKALEQAAAAYKSAGLREKEFGCVETLLNAFPSYVNYQQMVDREYQIGNDFFKGHRDPEYMALSWIPWLTGGDKTAMIYEAALEHAPFSAYAPQARLRLARLYLDDKKEDKALKQLRELIRNYPDSDARKYGYLELIDTLIVLARAGDGDGAYNREANEVMADFLRLYPNATEAEWVKKRVIEARDINAQRYYDLAKFYSRIGRNEPAERYLNRVLRDYPDTLPVDKSEELLSKIDTKSEPLKFRPPLESRYQKYPETSLPEEAEPIMIVPESSGNKWLLPIRDLARENQVEIKGDKQK